MNVLKALNWRYAVRKFSAMTIDDDKVTELLAATRLSASSYGLQPYRLIVVKDKAIRKRLLPHAMGQDKVANCSHLVVFAAKTELGDSMIDHYLRATAKTRGIELSDLDGFAYHVKAVFAEMDNKQRREWAHQQAYIALGTLLTSAAIMRIDSCPMTGFEAEGFDRVLHLNERGLESVVIASLGIRHEDDANALLPKVRYDAKEMVIAI